MHDSVLLQTIAGLHVGRIYGSVGNLQQERCAASRGVAAADWYRMRGDAGEWRNGRRWGLKIPSGNTGCGFDSRLAQWGFRCATSLALSVFWDGSIRIQLHRDWMNSQPLSGGSGRATFFLQIICTILTKRVGHRAEAVIRFWYRARDSESLRMPCRRKKHTSSRVVEHV